MKLSAPIYVLKQQAKTMSRRDKVRLNVALDQVATREGFRAWSHLASTWQRQDASHMVYQQLASGDLVLVAARPRQGKTLLSIGLALEAMTRGHHAALFTLEYTIEEVNRRFAALGRSMSDYRDRLVVDTSEDISADYIAQQMAAAAPGTLVVIDYLQLLDQRRDKPSLDDQVRDLRAFACAKQAIVVCLSQISRDYEPTTRAYPGLQDVRLPNPADLSLFSKACFLQNGKMELHLGS